MSKGVSIDYKNSIKDLANTTYAHFGTEMMELIPSSHLSTAFEILNLKK